MALQRFRCAFRSVFAVLLLVIFIAGIFINLAVFVFFRQVFKSAGRTTFKNNLIAYAGYIVDDVGTPPDPERARVIARTHGIDIWFRGPAGQWATTSNSSPGQKGRLRLIYSQGNTQIAHYRERHFITVRTDAGVFTLALADDFRKRLVEHGHVIQLLFLLSLILLVAFLVLRRLLKPLALLKEGARRVGEGRLDHRVPIRRKDELGDLAAAFNEMTQRIGRMLHAREQLMLDVSHELRTPITRMKVALEFLADGKVKANLQADVLEMEQMVTEILETARLRNVNGDLKRQAVLLGDLIREVAGLYPQAPGLQLHVPDGVTVSGEPELLRTVFKNLFSNALKYSEADSGPVQVRLQGRAGWAVVAVTDHGIGIPAEDLPHIFEPFYRVDKSRSKRTGGYGLGLNLCKTIVEAHGGHIEIESTPERGTTVTVRLLL